jgi:U3 small nucleolar RNA-associated protein 16
MNTTTSPDDLVLKISSSTQVRLNMARKRENIVLSSGPAGPAAEVIELSSDAESDYEEYLQHEDVKGSKNESPSEFAAPTKRKAKDDDKDDEGEGSRDKSASPTTKRQRLPMRVKDTGTHHGHRKVEIEIPIPSRAQKRPSPSTVAEGAGVTEQRPAKLAHIRFDDDGQADQFYTPLEAPARNPIEMAAPLRPAAGIPGEETVEAAADADSDDDAPPEAVSTSAAAAQTLESAQRAQRAAEE